MTARREPVKAPRKPSVIERLLNVRRPWPVRRNPVYAIVAVHKIARTFKKPSHLAVEFLIVLQNTSCRGKSSLGQFKSWPSCPKALPFCGFARSFIGLQAKLLFMCWAITALSVSLLQERRGRDSPKFHRRESPPPYLTSGPTFRPTSPVPPGWREPPERFHEPEQDRIPGQFSGPRAPGNARKVVLLSLSRGAHSYELPARCGFC